jgi:CDP-diacylglycerol---glycerol-3-phosphate 3-phosphatidyltransferase
VTGADEPAAAAAMAAAPLVNAANGLTALRLALVPIFVLLVVASGLTAPSWRIAACLTFGFASATDLVDGWIARRWGLVTSFGKVADPIADKALTGAALVLLSWYDRVPWWVTIVILGREIGVTLIRFWVLRYGVIPASRGGKAKTALQILAIVWYLWPVPQPVAMIGPWILAAALVATVVSGLDYVVRALRLRARPATASAGEGRNDARE